MKKENPSGMKNKKKKIKQEKCIKQISHVEGIYTIITGLI